MTYMKKNDDGSILAFFSASLKKYSRGNCFVNW